MSEKKRVVVIDSTTGEPRYVLHVHPNCSGISIPLATQDTSPWGPAFDFSVIHRRFTVMRLGSTRATWPFAFLHPSELEALDRMSTSDLPPCLYRIP